MVGSEQYNLPAGTKADLGYFPSFECNRKPISNNAISTHLVEGIQTDLLLTANEAVKSSYVREFLVAALRGFIRSGIEAKVYPETTEISRDGAKWKK